MAVREALKTRSKSCERVIWRHSAQRSFEEAVGGHFGAAEVASAGVALGFLGYLALDCR
jgi:hypothetical protein